MKKSLILGLVLGLTTVWASSSALAQKADDKEGGRGAAKGEKGAKADKGAGKSSKGGKGAKGDKGKSGGKSKKDKASKPDPLQAIGEAMTKELNLTEKQQADIKKLFADYQAKRAKSGESEAQKKETEALKAELKEARKSKDQEKVKEIGQKMKALKKDSAENAVDPEFFEAVAKTLDEKQKDPYWQIVSRYAGDGSGGAMIAKYEKALSGLNLSPEQKTATDKILQKFDEETIALAPDEREKAKSLILKLKDDINAQLKEDQQAAFHKLLKEDGKADTSDKQGKGQGGKESRGGKGGGSGGGKSKSGKGGGGQDD